MRLRLIPIAAGTALLAVSLLGTPAATAQGEVILASSSSNPVSVSDPAAGECITEGGGFYGSSVDNLTDAEVELYETAGCTGTPFAVLAPGESRMISLDTRVGAFRARS